MAFRFKVSFGWLSKGTMAEGEGIEPSPFLGGGFRDRVRSMRRAFRLEHSQRIELC